jgi:hypothetical protein
VNAIIEDDSNGQPAHVSPYLIEDQDEELLTV